MPEQSSGCADNAVVCTAVLTWARFLDHAGHNTASYLEWTAPAAGAYTVLVHGYSADQFGSYQVTVANSGAVRAADAKPLRSRRARDRSAPLPPAPPAWRHSCT